MQVGAVTPTRSSHTDSVRDSVIADLRQSADVRKVDLPFQNFPVGEPHGGIDRCDTSFVILSNGSERTVSKSVYTSCSVTFGLGLHIRPRQVLILSCAHFVVRSSAVTNKIPCFSLVLNFDFSDLGLCHPGSSLYNPKTRNRILVSLRPLPKILSIPPQLLY